MSPTVFKQGPYRYYFFSREETRMHIHVLSADGEAKIWMEPFIELADHNGLSEQELKIILDIAKDRKEEIHAKWNTHFKG